MLSLTAAPQRGKFKHFLGTTLGTIGQGRMNELTVSFALSPCFVAEAQRTNGHFSPHQPQSRVCVCAHSRVGMGVRTHALVHAFTYVNEHACGKP